MRQHLARKLIQLLHLITYRYKPGLSTDIGVLNLLTRHYLEDNVGLNPGYAEEECCALLLRNYYPNPVRIRYGHSDYLCVHRRNLF